jgi:hypothetical protein
MHGYGHGLVVESQALPVVPVAIATLATLGSTSPPVSERARFLVLS